MSGNEYNGNIISDLNLEVSLTKVSGFMIPLLYLMGLISESSSGWRTENSGTHSSIQGLLLSVLP